MSQAAGAGHGHAAANGRGRPRQSGHRRMVHSRLKDPETDKATSYQLLEKIGKGSYSHVYEAVNWNTNKKVAVKVFRSELPSRYLIARFEAEVMVACRHKHVIRLLDAGVEPEDNPNFIVMELMKEALDRVKKRFSYTEVKRIMEQLLRVVGYCHRRNVCHLDIKPGNILLDAEMNIKLADWGLACDLRNSRPSNIVYTMNYRPPELLLGAEDYDPFKAETWALGVVFAFLLLRNQDLFSHGWETEASMLTEIVKLFGKPDESSWPGVSSLESYSIVESIAPVRAPGLRKTFKNRYITPEPGALDLLEKMLTLDPSKRISINEALESSYFKRQK